jgi:hypothetical protein
MRIRLVFEPHEDVKINNNKTFRHYAENYLSEFPAEYGGFIMLDINETYYQRNEPLYQFLMHQGDDSILTDLLKYLQNNPMHGYHTHVYVNEKNLREVAISTR